VKNLTEWVLRKERRSAWLPYSVYNKIVKNLKEAVEDFRIDFEDGFGNRPDEEEDVLPYCRK
jgi:hypothetical protein